MGLHLLVVGIDLAAFGIVDPQGLDRADDDACTVSKVMRADLRKIADVEHLNPPLELCVERLPIRMARILQGLHGL